MKFATMRVRVPVDDTLPNATVYDHVRTLLEERGTEQLTLAPRPENGAEPELTPALPSIGRIHWTAVEVVEARERPPTTRPQKISRRNSHAAA